MPVGQYEAAKLLNVSLKTIYNECHRGKYIHTNSDLTTEVRYSAQIAQNKRDYNVTARGTIPKILKDKKLAKAIEEKKGSVIIVDPLSAIVLGR